MLHETHYARNGGASLAYQVFGNGQIDIVLGLGWLSHLDALWEEPRYAGFLSAFGEFARVIAYDARGTGLSDAVPLSEPVSLADRAADLGAVLDAAGARQPALIAIGASALTFAHFATRRPDRVRALVTINSAAMVPDRGRGAGSGSVAVELETIAPGAAHEPAFASWWSTYVRRCSSPGLVRALANANSAIDVRPDLGDISVPTLVLHRTGDRAVSVEHGRSLAAAIPGALFREIPGDDHLPYVGDYVSIVGEVEEFLTGQRRTRELDNVLRTVLVIDVVDTAETSIRLGDRRWAEVWTRFEALVSSEIQRHRGHQMPWTLTGAVGSFRDPVPAMQCALSILNGSQPLGLASRFGLHTGEMLDARAAVAGVTVHLASRVASLAAAGEVLITDSVFAMAYGGNLTIEPAGEFPIPGQPGAWLLHRVGRVDGSTPNAGMRTIERRPSNVLSRREREIAALLALGLSNRQIADELVISIATVERHVANMLTKLGYRSRTQIAAWAVDHGLTAPSA